MWRLNKLRYLTLLPFIVLGSIFIILGFNTEPWELTDDGYPLDIFWFVMGGFFIIMSVIPFLIFYLLNKRKIKKIQRLIEFGLRGTAKILNSYATGAEINNMPVIKMELEINLPSREKYNITHKEIINPIDLHNFATGKILNVIVDRDKSKSIIIEKFL